MKAASIGFVLLALAGCAEVEAFRQQGLACNAAVTYAEAFGTPANRGPCWRRTVGHAFLGSIQSFTVETPGGNFAVLTYDGNRMIGASF